MKTFDDIAKEFINALEKGDIGWVDDFAKLLDCSLFALHRVIQQTFEATRVEKWEEKGEEATYYNLALDDVKSAQEIFMGEESDGEMYKKLNNGFSLHIKEE